MIQLYIGNLSSDAREDDIKDFFQKLGRIRTVNIKQGFAFVVSPPYSPLPTLPLPSSITPFQEFEDERDVDDAIYDYNGRDLLGRAVRLEKAHGNGKCSLTACYHCSH